MAAENGLCISGNMYCQFKILWCSIYEYKDEDVECSMYNAVYIHNLKCLLSVDVSLKGTFILSNYFFIVLSIQWTLLDAGKCGWRNNSVSISFRVDYSILDLYLFGTIQSPTLNTEWQELLFSCGCHK